MLCILCNDLLAEIRAFKLQIRLTVKFVKQFDDMKSPEAFLKNEQRLLLRVNNIEQEVIQIAP